jgi:DNA-binding XRE family transcriptional regulator
MTTTAERIKKVRDTLGVGMPQFGKWAGGLSKQAVYNWEKGKNMPDGDALLSLQKSKHVNPFYIRDGKPPMFINWMKQGSLSEKKSVINELRADYLPSLSPGTIFLLKEITTCAHDLTEDEAKMLALEIKLLCQSREKTEETKFEIDNRMSAFLERFKKDDTMV